VHSERARPGRIEPREVVELRRLRIAHPELAGAIDMQVELVELYRRVHPRLRTPVLQRDRAILARQLADGERLVGFDDLLVEWSELRLLFRQIVDVLRRSSALDASDHVRLHAIGRDARPLEALARDYYARTARPDRVLSPPADQPALLDEVLALSLRPFLTRCAESWMPALDFSTWHRGYCPLCGFEPELGTLTHHDRLLICGRCAAHWPLPAPTCPFCGETRASHMTSFASRDGRYRVYGCNSCRRYLKAYNAVGADRPALPVVDAIATLPLDAAAMQQGYGVEA
jgi:FdhE protein